MGVAAQKLLDLAALHVGESYVLGTFVPMDNPNWHGPWDCSEFASWLIYQTSAKLYGCDNDSGNPATAKAFTGYWKRDAAQLGEIVTLEEATATPGAFLLRFPVPGGVGHVVVSDGRGGTIEAHGHADGVIRGVVAGRRWDTGVKVPGFDYATGALPAPMAMPHILRLTMPSMSGPEVLALQRALAAARFDPGVQDGVFGPHTSAAVISYQASKGLAPDGEAGPLTLRSLGL